MDGDLCPSCGRWGVIVEMSGWCLACTQDHYPDLRFCSECYTAIPAHHNHKLCYPCKAEKWLAEHADQIEVYMMVGWSFAAAKQQVIQDIRPNCVNCGDPILGGNSDALFCTTNKECRTTQRRYRLNREKGMEREKALRQALKAGRSLDEHDCAAA